MTQPNAKIRDLISSLHSKSTALNKLLPVKICGFTVLGLVDSGNSFYNAISLAVANKIGLSNFNHYAGPPVGTALIGSTLDIVGIVDNITLGLTDESGRQHSISSRLVIVKQLSCGLNISLPFMVENGISQLHPHGVLLWSKNNIRFPLYRNKQHAHKVMQGSPQISTITLGNSTAEVSNRIRQTIPPRTGKLINALVSGKTIVNEPTDTVFSYKNSFLNKISALSKENTLHPSQDEKYSGLNLLDQATSISDNNEVNVYFFNESNAPLTISSNCIIGSIVIPESHPVVIDMNTVMTIGPDSSAETSWLNNVPTNKLSLSSKTHRREYVREVLNVPSSPPLQEHPTVVEQILDLILSFWDIFYREGNCGGTEVIEHPVYTPKRSSSH